MSTVLLLIFALGVFFLVRLGMGARLNRDIPPPIVSSPGATPRTGDSNLTAPDNSGIDGEPGRPGSRDDSNLTAPDNSGIDSEPGRPESRHDSNTRAANPEIQPPRPVVQLSSVGGVGPRAVMPSHDFTLRVEFEVEQAFSVQVRVADLNIIQSGNEYFIEDPADEDVTKCDRGTIEPGETGLPLCIVVVEATEADPAVDHGILELVAGATCTSRTGRPCENLPEPYTPSPDNPIDVTWNYYMEWGHPPRPSESGTPPSPTPSWSTPTRS